MKNALILLLSFLVLSCSSNDNEVPPTEIETILIAKDNLYGNGAEGIGEQNIIISNQSAWSSLMNQMNSVNNVSDSFSETNIDFSEYKIIAVFDEIKNSGGYSLELDVTLNSEAIIVSITDIVPEGNVTTIITQPFHIIKITKSNLPILFE